MIDTTICFAVRMEGIKRTVGYIPEIRYLIEESRIIPELSSNK